VKTFLVIAACLMGSCGILCAQSWDRVKAETQVYLYGEGWGVTVAEADQQALSDLISKISTNVSAASGQEESQTIQGDQLDFRSYFNSTVNTYSQATLTNTERLVIEDEPSAHVGRWIKRTEVQKIFESRKAKVRELVQAAGRASSAGKVDDALRYYYWALTLLRSLQYPNEEQYTDEEGHTYMLTVWIPEQMNALFGDLSAEVTRREDNVVELAFKFRGRPVSSLDYTYFDGRDWSAIYSAKDGCGVLELAAGNTADSYRLKYEYEYRSEAHIDREVESVLKVVPAIPMKTAYVRISSTPKAGGVSDGLSGMASQSFSTLAPELRKAPTQLTEDASYRERIRKVIDGIQRHDYSVGKELFTAEGWEIYQGLMGYGVARIVGTPDLKFYPYEDKVMARGVQMSFSFRNGMRKSFVEDIVFTFNQKGLIENVSFGLGKTAEDDILCKGPWSDTVRLAIMQFLENYQTAFALKRLDYIQGIFDDDAVIIVGHEVRRATGRVGDTGNYNLSDREYEYIRYNKQNYLKQLAYSFQSKEFINLRFSNNEVKKLARGNLYGIQISQEYYSSNYGDKGYLFLIVDLNDPERPLIKVRTWQPQPDPKFGVYGPENFR
jgi:hypothetical protein